MGKGEIARYEQFLLFPRCFQRTCTAGCAVKMPEVKLPEVKMSEVKLPWAKMSEPKW